MTSDTGTHTLNTADMAKIKHLIRMNKQQRRTMLITLLMIVIWLISVAVLSERHYLSSSQQMVNQETLRSKELAGDLADSIQRNLTQLHGIPDMLSELLRVKWAVSRFTPTAPINNLPLEQRKQAWTDEPALNNLSRYLAQAQQSLSADMVYVVNANGDCIAASNWDTPGSCIGTNFAERDYFKSNQRGQRGMQYAVGKTTHIAGLYFSTPVFIDGEFRGAVVAKADIPHLSFLIKQFDSFLTDDYGVIVLARDKTLEMHVLPDSKIADISMEQRFARYNTKELPTLSIRPFENNRIQDLFQLENESLPHIMVTTDLPNYALHVHIIRDMDNLPAFNRNHFWITVLIGALGCLLILATGITAIYLNSIKQSKALLWRKANFDSLTELPNRDMFLDRLSQELKKSVRSGTPVALLLLDLDQFKEVNDTLGHELGDMLLQQAAHRIVHCVRASDTVARLGGDEFALVLPLISDPRIVKQIAQKIISRLAEPFHLNKEIIHISASIGITMYPADATEIVNLLRNADQAMYAAKNEGRNRSCYFTLALQETAQKRLHMINDLRIALTENQFRVVFQPIVELATGHVHKAEVLVRWQHPERGMISPAEFIPLAEETKLIVGIGAWVRQASMAWCKRWNALEPGGFQISVNKSPAEFMDEHDNANVEQFVHDLENMALNGNHYVLEITEGLLLNANQNIHEKLMELRDNGIQVAIDDFGTGYSSLSYLKKFDIDYLKIDQSFVRNLQADSDDMALCEAIIVMAHKLGLKVIAEGVETEQQRDLLTRAGCNYGQGYLFSRPLPPDTFEQWLVAHNGTATGTT
ncbi:MAG: EAL domain-containing protein [Gallionella sp.]|nr:EAL domain-containing protein [Gallionella sp.]MDD4946900.1 EAL domain-containing protein [Gallionella sp.]